MVCCDPRHCVVSSHAMQERDSWQEKYLALHAECLALHSEAAAAKREVQRLGHENEQLTYVLERTVAASGAETTTAPGSTALPAASGETTCNAPAMSSLSSQVRGGSVHACMHPCLQAPREAEKACVSTSKGHGSFQHEPVAARAGRAMHRAA